MNTRQIIEAHAFGPADPTRRKKQLSVRPPGHQTAMLKKRSDDDAKDLVQHMIGKARGADAASQSAA